MSSFSCTQVPRTMPRPAIPIEVCERIIDALADLVDQYLGGYKSMLACMQVCHDWVPRSHVHLFEHVELKTELGTQRFLDALSSSCSPGKHVKTLHLDGTLINMESSQVNMGWVYKALHHLSKYLTNLEILWLYALPSLHPTSILHCAQFSTIKELYVHKMKFSFCDLIQLVNKLPSLHNLQIWFCHWSQPAHCYAGKKHQITSLEFNNHASESECGVDLLRWFLKSGSALSLVELRWWRVFSSQISLLNEFLCLCGNTLKEVSFEFDKSAKGM